MTYKLPKWKGISVAAVTPLIYFMTLLSIASFFIGSGPLLKRVLAVICFIYASYFITVVARSISTDEKLIYFNRVINKKQIETEDILSIHRSKLIGCLVFKSTSGKVWVMEGIIDINDLIQTIKTDNPAVNVVV